MGAEGSGDPPRAGRSSKGRFRALSAEELDLWRKVVRHDRPLETKAAPRAEAPKPPNGGPPASPSPRAVVRPAGRSEPPVRFQPAREPIDPLHGAVPGLDRNTARRLKKGRVTPDARLDLHGMTAEGAHQALRSFIIREQASGSRCVLVITGKGAGRERPGDLRPAGAGVLKTQTPHWLSTPPLSGLVVGIYEANIRHGGGGALYVYLKKSRR